MFFSGKSLFAKLCFKLSSNFVYKNGKTNFYSGDMFLIQYLCLTLVKTCSKAEKAAFPGKLISTFISSLTIYEMSTALRTVQLLGKNKQESLLFLYVRRESRVLALTWFSAATSISKQIANNSMQLDEALCNFIQLNAIIWNTTGWNMNARFFYIHMSKHSYIPRCVPVPICSLWLCVP